MTIMPSGGDEGATNVDRDEIVKTLLRNRGELQGLGVTSLSIFGSRARGDFRPESDLDLIVDYDPRDFSLIELVGVQQAVERMTGYAVQVTTRRSLPQRSRRIIEAEAVTVF